LRSCFFGPSRSDLERNFEQFRKINNASSGGLKTPVIAPMNTQASREEAAPHLRKRQDMFGKPRDIHDPDTLDTSALDEFFGDGSAAENTVEIHELRDRVEQVEAQISSQFTSLATYAQIAQEQVELARSEAKAATERSEQRLTSLIERERADRITSFTGVAPDGAPDRSPEHSSETTSRLDALEESVARIAEGLDQCRRQQKDLAHAITAMFDWLTESTVLGVKRDASTRSSKLPAPSPAPSADEPAAFPAPSPAASADEPAAFPAPSPAASADEPMLDADDGFDGPIVGLALNG
jgi:hypothetical protein